MASELPDVLFEELHTRFEALKGDFKRIDAEADQRITHWRYAEHSAFELRVEFYRRFNETPGQLMDEEPVGSGSYWAYMAMTRRGVFSARRFSCGTRSRTRTLFTTMLPVTLRLPNLAPRPFRSATSFKKWGG